MYYRYCAIAIQQSLHIRLGNKCTTVLLPTNKRGKIVHTVTKNRVKASIVQVVFGLLS